MSTIQNTSTFLGYILQIVSFPFFSVLQELYKFSLSDLEIGQETAVSTKGYRNGHCVLPQILSQEFVQ